MTADPGCSCGWQPAGAGVQVHCCVCHDNIPDAAAWADHARLLHPAQWGDGPERWPDGEPVIHDATLEPEDFR